MSFQDVGRPGSGARGGGQQRRTPKGGYSSNGGGAFSSAAAASSRPRSGGGAGAPSSGGLGSSLSQGLGGYEHVSDSIVQYQRNVSLLEKMARSVGTPNDTSVTQTQYNLQLDVINQLGQRIEAQFKSHEQRLTTLPRTEASSLRTTHVKLSRDYRLVEQQFKNVQLDVKRKRGLAEAKQREVVRMEEEEKERKRRGDTAGGLGGDMSDSAMRYQMQIHEDKINEEIMREREEEIRTIHKGMHTVNEIYKDLAGLVDEQQEGVDTIETQMENTKENTATGLKHIEKANESSQSQCVIS